MNLMKFDERTRRPFIRIDNDVNANTHFRKIFQCQYQTYVFDITE